MNAANRAAARNINRQNRASTLSTWGQILRDRNQREMDELRMLMVEPMLDYAFENSDKIKVKTNLNKPK